MSCLGSQRAGSFFFKLIQMIGLTKNTETKTENESLVSAGQNTNQSVSKLREWGCWCCCCCLRKQEATAAAASWGTITASTVRGGCSATRQRRSLQGEQRMALRALFDSQLALAGIH